MRDRAAREGTMQLGRRHVAFALIQQPYVTAQGNRGQAVLGVIRVLAYTRQQRFAEADTEAQHLEAEFLGDPVVSEFMNGHQDTNRNQEGGGYDQKHHAGAPALCSIMVTARRRAAASASKTSPKALTGDAVSRCSTFSMTVEIPTKFKRRSRNA